jgi:penicillin-binding protein A
MTGNLSRLAGLMLSAFVVLSLGLSYWTVVRGAELLTLPNNARTIEFEKQVQRGRIFDRHGAVLADTRMTADGAQRVYPYTPLAPVLGYYSLRYGVGGIEAAFNNQLRGYGADNSLALERYRLFHDIPVGNDVHLTLDLNLQREADRLLGERRGSIILMEPNGAVVAMASHPGYDPNRLDDTFPQLSADPAAPLLNRATQGVYPPGSVWKTETLAAALDAGTTRPDRVYNDGAETLVVNGFPIRCNNNPEGVNSFDLAHAYGYSCNLTFARLALELGTPRYTEYANAFRATTDQPLEIPVAKSSLANGDLSNQVLLASTGFGQGELQQTPFSIAMIGATVANGGRMPRPHLLKEVTTRGGNRLQRPRLDPQGAPIRPETAEQVLQIMETAVNEGYANAAKVPGTRVGGKTGTAQTGGPTTRPHAWFLGVAPVDQPRYIVVVMIENGGEGSEVAAPLAGRMLAAALKTTDGK